MDQKRVVFTKISRFLVLYGCFAAPALLHGQVPVPAAYAPTAGWNIVREWTPVTPVTDEALITVKPVEEVRQQVSYMDGLARVVQTVRKQGSPLKKDVVTAATYDAYGRNTYSYLPFVSCGTGATGDGLLKADAFQQQAAFMNSRYGAQGETFYYGETVFEASPLNRVIKSFAPGNSWAGSGGTSTERMQQQQYLSNTVEDAVKLFTIADAPGSLPASAAAYGAGELYKNIVTDEQGEKTVEFTDKEGKVLLKKVQVSSTPGAAYTGWLCTHYVYDHYNQLRFVLPPLAVEKYLAGTSVAALAGELCFSYDYDQRSRMVRKKVPGAAEVYMVYDARDRLVMTQDGQLRGSPARWLVTVYDGLNRPVSTGLLTSAESQATHAAAAAASAGYPSTATGFELLSETYYDDYSWVAGSGSGLGSTLHTTYTGNSDYFFTTYHTSPDFARPVSAAYFTRGRATGSRVKVLGTTAGFLYSVLFYDDRGNTLQVQSTNATGGTDIVTTQYNFAGRPLRTLTEHTRGGAASPQSYLVLTKNRYDAGDRLLDIAKSISGEVGGQPVTAVTDHILAALSYNESGGLEEKQLAPAYNGGAGLESLTYDYNIRGWLLGMNREYARDASGADNYFGFDLGYDKTANGLVGGQSYTQAQYTGNITGMVWKSKGDGEKRKYDFEYDGASRLLKGAFTQYTGSVFDVSAGVDYSLGGDPLTGGTMQYDANGNILGMWQKGLKITASDYIDQLDYSYMAGSNKLLSVTERSLGTTDNKLGDFTDKNTGNDDYSYDDNGNLALDKNKGISSISYNYLNLPQAITVTGKGGITYTYDAAGNKLKKQTTDTSVPGKTITTTTEYVGGMVYESKSTSPAPSPGDDYTGVLQFLGHEEGRIRVNPAVDGTPASFGFDYFIKDQLGNVRMVLTEEVQQDKYPTATLETVKLETEKKYYDIQDANIVDRSAASGITDYLNDNGIGNHPSDPGFEATNSAKLYKLNSSTAKAGLGITLKVMAGDKVDVLGKSYYFHNTSGTGGNSTLPVIELLNAFLNAPASVGALHGISGTDINVPSGLTGINSMLTQQAAQSDNAPDRPRAFINVLFFDEQFRSYEYHLSMAGDNSVVKDHFSELQHLAVNKSGYVYIYCSNESPVDVFFDNVQVVHTRGPILEETHYYPFGLTMVGISSKAAGSLENNMQKFQGQEFAHKEFSDGSGLEMYEFKYRMDDPQTGRFWQIDPLAEKYVYNSTYAFSENRVINGVELEGLEVVLVNEKKDPVIYNAAIKEKDNSAIHIFAHGNPSSILGKDGFIKTPEAFDKMLTQESDAWKNRKEGEHLTVILHACRTGNDGYDGEGKYESAPESFANRMSQAFPNVSFIAPDERDVFAAEPNKPETAREVGPRKLINGNANSDPKETDKNGNILSHDKSHATGSEQGTWRVFDNGKVTAIYDGSWKPNANPGFWEKIFHKN